MGRKLGSIIIVVLFFLFGLVGCTNKIYLKDDETYLFEINGESYHSQGYMGWGAKKVQEKKCLGRLVPVQEKYNYDVRVYPLEDDSEMNFLMLYGLNNFKNDWSLNSKADIELLYPDETTIQRLDFHKYERDYKKQISYPDQASWGEVGTMAASSITDIKLIKRFYTELLINENILVNVHGTPVKEIERIAGEFFLGELIGFSFQYPMLIANDASVYKQNGVYYVQRMEIHPTGEKEIYYVRMPTDLMEELLGIG